MGPFRQAFSQENQEAFDRMVVCAKRQVQTEVQCGRPWRFKAVLMAIVLEQPKQVERLKSLLDELQSHKQGERLKQEDGLFDRPNQFLTIHTRLVHHPRDRRDVEWDADASSEDVHCLRGSRQWRLEGRSHHACSVGA